MVATRDGRRFFAVKVWREWLPKVDGEGHVELCLDLVRASNAHEACRVAWTEHLQGDGFGTWCHGQPVTVHALGTDQVFDTGRNALEDFEDDPLVFTHLFPAREKWVDYFERGRLIRPEPVPGPPFPNKDLPELVHLDGYAERFFGVKFWRTWTVGDEDRSFEEIVLMVRARSAREAATRATALAIAADTDVVNDAGESVHVRTVNLHFVWDTSSATLVDKIGSEVFGLLYSLNPDDSVEYFEPDDDLPFREGALGWDRPLPPESR